MEAIVSLCGPAPYSHTIISTVFSWLGGKHHWGHPAGDLLQLGTVLTMLPQPHLIWPHPPPPCPSLATSVTHFLWLWLPLLFCPHLLY